MRNSLNIVEGPTVLDDVGFTFDDGEGWSICQMQQSKEDNHVRHNTNQSCDQVYDNTHTCDAFT